MCACMRLACMLLSMVAQGFSIKLAASLQGQFRRGSLTLWSRVLLKVKSKMKMSKSWM